MKNQQVVVQTQYAYLKVKKPEVDPNAPPKSVTEAVTKPEEAAAKSVAVKPEDKGPNRKERKTQQWIDSIK